MTCRDVMTANPSCCLPSDTVAAAAQLMKSQDVGSVPVVEDKSSNRLVGIVTDRDLALHVVAEGRDPHTTTVTNVMTNSPVMCRVENDYEDALDLMAKHQLRRIPVVDGGGRLEGIISQADVARHGDDAESGDLLEDISKPSGLFSGSFNRPRHSHADDTSANAATAVMTGLCCAALGASLLYLLDPKRGTRRRNELRDKASSLYNRSGESLKSTQRDWTNRASGLATEAKTWWNDEPLSDDKLVGRVQAKLEQIASNPHGIQVLARDGYVTLHGTVDSHELNSLLRQVANTQGVRDVIDRLSIRQGSTKSSIDMPGSQTDWTPATRLLMSVVGGGLTFYGFRSSSMASKPAATVGVGLLASSVTNRDLTSVVPFNAARKAIGL